ncbi:uncharacterized protein N7473_002159 [Penicillium subrubescens]|uniref:uncharacterized protein n=1 Tax=Penicillium subrubescens TaxID=1316194 RepID=UPI002545A410|nr:uncharacterized protein N7473_002159 [Penicillium subrubescens]KAJ5905243.1 hypothetical protein N7473_002159 [Penicillium subrubescens]
MFPILAFYIMPSENYKDILDCRLRKDALLASKKSGPGVNDLGAAWINDTTQSEMYKLIQKYGLQGEVQMDSGNDVWEHDDGVILSPHGVLPEQAALGQVIGRFTELATDVNLEDPMAGPVAKELDSDSLHEYCLQEFQSEQIATLLNTVSQSLVGIESKDISALSFLHSCKSGTGFQAVISDTKHGAQYLRVQQGTQTISKNIAKELKEDKQHLAQESILGYQSKMIFVFEKPWWRSAGLFGEIKAQDRGPILFSVDTKGRYSSAWNQFRSAFEKVVLESGKLEIPEPINALEYEWSKQEFFLGSPCPASPPRLMSAASGDALRKPFENVHFVGIETALEWKGYMEGAIRSGDRGTAEVIAALWY